MKAYLQQWKERTMRTVIVNNIVSLDGFTASEDGNPLVLQMDAAFDQANLQSISSADLVLLGRDSFDGSVGGMWNEVITTSQQFDFFEWIRFGGLVAALGKIILQGWPHYCYRSSMNSKSKNINTQTEIGENVQGYLSH